MQATGPGPWWAASMPNAVLKISPVLHPTPKTSKPLARSILARVRLSRMRATQVAMPILWYPIRLAKRMVSWTLGHFR